MKLFEKILFVTGITLTGFYLLDVYRRNTAIYQNIDKSEVLPSIDLFIWNIKRIFNMKHYEKIPVTPIVPEASNNLKIIPIGHSTVLIQLDGKNIITDPNYSKLACSYKPRYKEPCIKFEDLPQIDVVLISHNHCDHFDRNTLLALNKKFHPQFLVPKGNKRLLNSLGITNVQEMEWWENYINEIEYIFVPAQHYSGRLLHYNQTLWGGYVIKGKSGTIYFAGDTAYGTFIKLLKDKYNNFDYCLLPISPDSPEYLMNPIHLNSREAQEMNKELNCKQSIPIHYDTFRQGDDEQKKKFIESDNFKINNNCSI